MGRGKRIRRNFPTLAAAKLWRYEAEGQKAKGTLAEPSPKRLREAADEWIAGAESGVVRTRRGDRYKPSAIRAYRDALDRRVLPELGDYRLADLRKPHVQALVKRLQGEKQRNGRYLDASTIRNAVVPLRAIYREAYDAGEIAVNPTTGLKLPRVDGKRDRIATPDEAERLIAALREDDRAVWSVGVYAGLRLGEVQALRWEDVDLAAGIIRVEWNWDRVARELVAPKSEAGRRTVPIVGVLRDELIEHSIRQGRGGEGLVFGRTASEPFDARALTRRADRRWLREGLDRLTFHEARHTFAALMIAAGVNAKALSEFMGHSSIDITIDRYGHLMPGAEAEAAALLDAYLTSAHERAEATARAAETTATA